MLDNSMYGVKIEDYLISDEMDDRAASAMRRCWQSIAMDCLVGDDGETDESITMTRSEVLEVVLDANRLEDYDKEAAQYTIWVKWFQPEHWKLLQLQAFPYSVYGY